MEPIEYYYTCDYLYCNQPLVRGQLKWLSLHRKDKRRPLRYACSTECMRKLARIHEDHEFYAGPVIDYKASLKTFYLFVAQDMASLLDAVHDLSERVAELERRIAKLFPKNPCEDGHDWTHWMQHPWRPGMRERFCVREDCDEVEYCGNAVDPHTWCWDIEGKCEGNTCRNCNANKV